MRKALKRPTDTELTILRVLWERGPATVRQVFDHLAPNQVDLGYPAVLRMMQLMAEKGLLLRDDEERSHVYRSAKSQAEVQGTLVDDFLERAFGGNALEMLAATLARRKMNPAEREEAGRLIAQALEDKS